MAKDAYYFSHDSNARNDVRMIKLRRMGGLESVGLYWCVIEMLREADDYELPVDTIEDICYEFRVNITSFEILFICELLIQDESVFYSNSLKNRMVKLDEIKEKRAIAGREGGKSKANAKQMLSNKSIVKQSKVNDIKEEKSKGFTVPTFEEVKDYCKERNKGVNPNKWYNHYTSNGWKVGKNPMKNWKAAVHTWEDSDIVAPGKLPESKGSNLGGSKIPDNYGLPSKTAVPMPDSFKKRLDKIGT